MNHMNLNTVSLQKEAANENLTRINAPFRLALMSQNKRRITIEVGTIQQIKDGLVQNNLLVSASLNEASKFLNGFNACLNALNVYNMPINKPVKQ